jgi:hypothetical protein
MSPTTARIAVVFSLVLAVALPGLARSGGDGRQMRVALVVGGVESQGKAQSVACALRVPVQTVLTRPNGFAARLSDEEVGRLRIDPEVFVVRSDPASWLVRINSSDPAVVEARTRELEHLLGVTSDHRYNTRTVRGFAAVIGSSQLARLSDQSDVVVSPDPFGYMVFYARGTDVDARTDELERQYGFTSTFRFYGLTAFGAQLAGSQLVGLATEPDIDAILPDLDNQSGSSRADCLRSSPGLRRQLRAAFVRAHPKLAGKRLRGPFRVRFASFRPVSMDGWTLTPKDFALATFSHPQLAPETQPESFWRAPRETRIRWRPLGATNGIACIPAEGDGPIPRLVLRAWLLPPAGPANCYSTR